MMSQKLDNHIYIYTFILSWNIMPKMLNMLSETSRLKFGDCDEMGVALAGSGDLSGIRFLAGLAGWYLLMLRL